MSALLKSQFCTSIFKLIRRGPAPCTPAKARPLDPAGASPGNETWPLRREDVSVEEQ